MSEENGDKLFKARCAQCHTCQKVCDDFVYFVFFLLSSQFITMKITAKKKLGTNEFIIEFVNSTPFFVS